MGALKHPILSSDWLEMAAVQVGHIVVWAIPLELHIGGGYDAALVHEDGMHHSACEKDRLPIESEGQRARISA